MRGTIFLVSFSLILFELLLTRIFAVVLFAQFAHLALAIALLGIGVGAIAQHLRPSLVPEAGPDGRMERRLGWWSLALAGSAVLAVLAALYFPVLDAPEVGPSDYQDRSYNTAVLLNTGWFVAMLPLLMLPCAVAGLIFAGMFQRLKDQIGQIYAADLIGGAFGAVVFLPVLGWLAGPDTVFLIVTTAALAALAAFWQAKDRRGLWAAGAAALLGAALSVGSAVGGGGGSLLPVREAAGYSERDVVYTRWTPLVRLAVWEQAGETKILLDNTSASEVVKTAADRDRMVDHAARSLVFRLGGQPDGASGGASDNAAARVAILAASAGPEVAAAQALGFSDIDAIDIASEIFSLVATRFPDAPANPFLQPGVRHVHSDGRAAILRAERPYDIILMVHANLWSAAGLLASAWSPALLETREAFGTYLDHLSPDGTISFGKGSATTSLLPSILAALRERGVKEPGRCVALIEGNSSLVLVKHRPWTEEEAARLRASLTLYRNATLTLDPAAADATAALTRLARKEPLMTDNRPYMDTPDLVWEALRGLMPGGSGERLSSLKVLYRSLMVQMLAVLAAGALFVGAPMARYWRSDVAGLTGGGGVLLYVAGLGYGYLALETVLIHQLVLFVGHPTYAITVVVLSMMLASGLGSMVTGRLAEAGLVRSLRWVLGGVLVLGGVQTWVLPPLLYATALSLPLAARLAVTFVGLLPLGFLMGMPFPLSLRILPRGAAGIIPWAWAINGWMSVVASMFTVLLSRIYGYPAAFGVALGFYAVAFAAVGRLARARSVRHAGCWRE